MPCCLAILLALQALQTVSAQPRHATATSVEATLAATPPVIDGRDNDAVWASAPVIDQFLEAKPTEGAPPKERTEARVAYDAHNLYVFVRAYDPHPDSIVRLLSRRDEPTASDHITILVDSYHDHRTGFEFSVNPAGVKTDYAIYNDGTEDPAWDGIWDAATRVDSLGWTAEYRIPLSQLHYSQRKGGVFGILIWRWIQRYTETITWPLYRMSRSGLVSQFGEATGLTGLARPGDLEVTPYLVTKNVQGPQSSGYDRRQQVSAGGDLKYQLSSTLLLNATANPDFGQVDADPSQINLSAFETFFAEQRPFFVEAKGLFTFSVNCVVVLDCNTGEGLFYSRRIGRAPELADVYDDSAAEQATRIVGAAKLTGRFANGLSLGVLDAVTDRVGGTDGVTLEPRANYAVVRANQDYAGGNGSVGLIFTGVNRSMDSSSSPYLHASAYAGGIDARRRFLGDYEVSGSLDASRVAGSPAAIALTQEDPVHLYQRPDGPLTFDATRTSLSGTNVELRAAKVGGKMLQWETAYQRRSPGFEINDMGFLLQADRQEWTTWAALAFRTPNAIWQQLRWNVNYWQFWSDAGLPTERAFNTNVHTQFNDRWWLHMGGTIGQLGTTFCDRCARGGPAIRQNPYIAPWLSIQGDDRDALLPSVSVNYWRGDGGRSHSLSVSPELDIKVSSRFATSVSAGYTRNRNDTQYFGTFTDSASVHHYTFAHLEQRTLSLTWRLDYTFTPNATLQLYASPFVSKGTYTDVRELADPRAVAYAARYRPYGDTTVTDDPGGFNAQQFRSNLVFRWEYRPGSTLFLVWTQGRDGSFPVAGTQSFGGDLRELFAQRSNDIFLIKFSYWFAR
ncbi:MAG TPA: DUF5916 domain-containing protein [Gemmatimonadaceae bacterium]|nr:DUF5916 domain-containing protein [Gemmatimonadaceae bacterium]